MHPMTRMYGIGIVCGIGLCNLLWMAVDYHPVNFAVIAFTITLLVYLYIDHLRYYREVQS